MDTLRRVGESAKAETAEVSAEFEGLEDVALTRAEKNSGWRECR
jgi:hypothetical protein